MQQNPKFSTSAALNVGLEESKQALRPHARPPLSTVHFSLKIWHLVATM